MQFMNTSLDKLVKNLSLESSEHLELLKQKGAYPYGYMNSLKKFPARKYFFS